MKLVILKNHQAIGSWVSKYLSKKITNFSPSLQKTNFVLGLPTGSTPLPLYRKLIQFYKKGDLSFKNVITFNMDEYIGLKKDHKESYSYFMYQNFFNYLDIKKGNINILNGSLNKRKDLILECINFEKKIEKVGGIDVFLGGVGVNGHIAFNEPGSSMLSKTRIVKLDKKTIESNARFFKGEESLVPKQALSVGIKTIMSANEVIIMASGKNKREAVKSAALGVVGSYSPISFLKLHRNFTLVCDIEASSLLDKETINYFKNINS